MKTGTFLNTLKPHFSVTDGGTFIRRNEEIVINIYGILVISFELKYQFSKTICTTIKRNEHLHQEEYMNFLI